MPFFFFQQIFTIYISYLIIAILSFISFSAASHDTNEENRIKWRSNFANNPQTYKYQYQKNIYEPSECLQSNMQITVVDNNVENVAFVDYLHYDLTLHEMYEYILRDICENNDQQIATALDVVSYATVDDLFFMIDDFSSDYGQSHGLLFHISLYFYN